MSINSECKNSNIDLYRSSGKGEDLTHDECWELWEAELDFQNEYENFEGGLSSEDDKAITDPFYGFAAMEASLYQRELYWAHESPTIQSVAAFFHRELGYEEMLKHQSTQDHIDYEYHESGQAKLDRINAERLKREEDEQLSGDIDWTPINEFNHATPQPIVSIHHDRIIELLSN